MTAHSLELTWTLADSLSSCTLRNDTEIEHKTKDKGYYLSLTFTSSLKGYRFHKNAKEIKQVSKISKEF